MQDVNLFGKRAILYSRVSTKEQQETGFSLDHQETQLLRFCKDSGVSVTRTYREAHSAKSFDRPQFNDLIKFCKQSKGKVDLILVVKWDRFSRDVLGTLQMLPDLKRLGVSINAIQEWKNLDDPTDWFMHLITMGTAQHENLQKSDRIKGGNHRAYTEGRHINRPPFGYMSGKDHQEKTLMKPHPKNAAIAKAILEDYSTGKFSQNEIREKYLTQGTVLSKSNLSRMLTNERYAGLMRVPAYKNEPEKLIPAAHEPLITESTFRRIQYYLNEKNRLKEKPVKDDNNLPLRGKLLKCPNCDRNLTGYTKTKNNGKQYHYYNCDGRLGCGFSCNATQANTEFVNHLKEISPSPVVMELFSKILIEKYASLRSTQEQELQKIHRRRQEVESSRTSLAEKLVENRIEQDMYDRLNAKYKEELGLIERTIADMPAHDEALDKYLSFGLSFISQLGVAYEKADIKTKKMILGSILSGNLVFDGKKYRTLEFIAPIALLSKSGKAFKKSNTKKGGSDSETSLYVLEAGLHNY